MADAPDLESGIFDVLVQVQSSAPTAPICRIEKVCKWELFLYIEGI